MPPVHSPVMLSDLPSVHKLNFSADQDSPTAQVLFPHYASKTSIAHMTQKDERNMQDPKSTSRHAMVRDVPNDTQRQRGKEMR